MAGAAALAGAVGWTAGPTAAEELLPHLYVTESRLGSGITGASTSIITAEDIQRAPESTLQDILSAQPGIQVQNLFGMVAGARSTVDMRGFGASAASNTLILINGRRLNDIDMAGVDFTAIPKNSIERIEITRGNSGAVLYGDNAVGGTINIVTKPRAGAPTGYRIEGLGGSYAYWEGAASANKAVGPWSISAYGNAINADGYRFNNELRQRNGVAEVRYSGIDSSGYFNVSGDDQHLGLPGGRRVTPTSSELVTNPSGAATPFDSGDKQGVNATIGFTRKLGNTAQLIVDGGVRHKAQQAAFFSNFGAIFDSHVDTTLTTTSLTPRIDIAHVLLGLPSRTITGIDVYYADYGSDRALHRGDTPYHRYDIYQMSVGGYLQTTVALRPDTDISIGGRLQDTAVKARDRFDPTAPGAAFVTVEGLPLHKTEINYAVHVGAEHRFDGTFALFGRVGRAFRTPNADERVGMSPFFVPTTFDLATQTSWDAEAGLRATHGPFRLQTSAYYMLLKDELFFSPATFINLNLDPTKRYGAEALASYQATDTVRLKGGLAYTRSVFREGAFAGNDVPLVSRWTGMVGASWMVVPKWLTFDTLVRFIGPRRMDNDAANRQPQIPWHAVVDVRLGGQVEQFFWAVSIQNLFDKFYYDYAVASAFSLGVFDAYPQPGRTIMVKAGATF
jgi:iron complex outermembrane receptor protein